VCRNELGENDALPLQPTFAGEVDEISDRLFRDAEVINELSLVLREELRNGFQFHDEAIENEQVGDITLLEFAGLVKTPQLLLGSERDSPQFQLDFEAFLVKFQGHTLGRCKLQTLRP
jgi:hypothetical protein